MTTRPEALKFMALVTTDTVVTVENHARSLTVPQVPAPFNTSLGRGNRHVHLKSDWLCSTFLAQVLNDPKNAAEQVPACANLRLWTTRFVERQETVYGNLLNALAPCLATNFETAAPSVKTWLGGTLFELLRRLVETVAIDWDGPLHKDLRAGFELTVTLGSYPWAEMELFYDHREDGSTRWIRTVYAPQNTDTDISLLTPIRRQAVIQVKHVEMLARLYADTLKHESVLLAVTPFNLAPAPADADAGTKNAGSLPGEPAPSDCQPSACTTDDTANSTHPKTDGLDNRGSNPGVCVSSSGKRVRAGSATSNRRRHHAPAPHHHASA